MSPDRDAPDFDAMAREWLDREGPTHDSVGRVVRVNLSNAGLHDSLSALLRQTYERGVRDEREACAKAQDAMAAHWRALEEDYRSRDKIDADYISIAVTQRQAYECAAAAIRARTP